MKSTIFIFVLFLCFACNNKQNSKSIPDNKVIEADTVLQTIASHDINSDIIINHTISNQQEADEKIDPNYKYFYVEIDTSQTRIIGDTINLINMTWWPIFPVGLYKSIEQFEMQLPSHTSTMVKWKDYFDIYVYTFIGEDWKMIVDIGSETVMEEFYVCIAKAEIQNNEINLYFDLHVGMKKSGFINQLGLQEIKSIDTYSMINIISALDGNENRFYFEDDVLKKIIIESGNLISKDFSY